jgi:hypothetical protein
MEPDLRNRANLAHAQIQIIKDPVARRDLKRMYNTVESILDDISSESVECRRLHRETQKYRDLVGQAESYMDNLEQNITFASLIYT